MQLLEKAPQKDVIHGSKAVGEPPFMLYNFSGYGFTACNFKFWYRRFASLGKSGNARGDFESDPRGKKPELGFCVPLPP